MPLAYDPARAMLGHPPFELTLGALAAVATALLE